MNVMSVKYSFPALTRNKSPCHPSCWAHSLSKERSPPRRISTYIYFSIIRVKACYFVWIRQPVNWHDSSSFCAFVTPPPCVQFCKPGLLLRHSLAFFAKPPHTRMQPSVFLKSCLPFLQLTGQWVPIFLDPFVC